VVDRPQLPSRYASYPTNREYVQPQWVLDSANNGVLLPVSKYGVGKDLPPHLSPWVDNEKEGYTPRYAEEIERIKRGEVGKVGEDGKDVGSSDSEEEGGEEEKNSDNSESEEEEEEEKEQPKKKQKKKKGKETSTTTTTTNNNNNNNNNEEHEMAKMMMSKKAARLYGRMQNGIDAKTSEAENLEAKRKEIEKRKRDELRAKDLLEEQQIQQNMEKGIFNERGSATKIGGLGLATKRPDPVSSKWGGGGKSKNDKGESVLKQKAERLKKKRKDLGAEYGESVGMTVSGGGKKKKRKGA